MPFALNIVEFEFLIHKIIFVYFTWRILLKESLNYSISSRKCSGCRPSNQVYSMSCCSRSKVPWNSVTKIKSTSPMWWSQCSRWLGKTKWLQSLCPYLSIDALFNEIVNIYELIERYTFENGAYLGHSAYGATLSELSDRELHVHQRYGHDYQV